MERHVHLLPFHKSRRVLGAELLVCGITILGNLRVFGKQPLDKGVAELCGVAHLRNYPNRKSFRF